MSNTDLKIRLPDNVQYKAAAEEYFFLTKDGTEKKVMLQDYETLYSMPYFYENLAYNYLNYQSPGVLFSMLKAYLQKNHLSAASLKVLEIGAGSGLMGKKLNELGVDSITAIDLIEDAAIAAQRDYPGVYQAYFVDDMSRMSESTTQCLDSAYFNCLVCCSALSHIPTKAFTGMFNLLALDSLVVFNIAKEDWEDKSDLGFTGRHPWLKNPEVFVLNFDKYYVHRKRTNGSAIDYVALIGLKTGQIDFAE